MGHTLTRRAFVCGVASLGAAPLATRAYAGPTTYEVKIKKFKFSPKKLEVNIGDTIRWTNADLAPHTATAKSKGWDSGKLAKNGSFEITVTEGMEEDYFCIYHPQMKGKLTIL